MLKLIEMGQDLVQATVDEIVSDGVRDFSGITVVVPSQRMLFFIRDRINSRVKGSYFPPDLTTIDHFVFRLFDANHPGLAKAGEMESVLAIYKTIHRIYQNPGYPGGKENHHFPDFFPWALMILKAVEELLIEGKYSDRLNQEIFEEFASLGEYHRDYKDFIGKLPLLAEQFKDHLLSAGLYSRGIAYKMAAILAEAEKLQIPKRKMIIFSGLSALNACEEKILKFIISSQNSRFLVRCDTSALGRQSAPFSQVDKMLQSLNLETVPARTGSPEWNRFSGKVNLYCLPNQESQMVQVAEILKAIVVARSHPEDLKKIAVILPDSTSLIPFIHGVVSRFSPKQKQIPFNISLGYPFRRTPLYQLLISMMKAAKSRLERGMIFSPDYLNLIRHPYVKFSGKTGKEEEPLKRGIHLIEDLISRENLLFFEPGKIEDQITLIMEKSDEYSVESSREIAGEVKRLHQTFLADGRNSLLELAEFLKQSVLAVGENKKHHLFLEDYINTAVNTLDQVIEFSGQHHDDLGTASFNSLISLLTHYFTGVHIYFQGSPLKGVQVMGMLESRGLNFDEVIVVDALEGVLPKSLKYDPLLPYDIRNAFGLSNYSQWEILFANNFFSLLGTVKKAHILWTDNNQAGSEKPEKSRFVERIIYEIEKQTREAPVVIRKNFPCRLETGELKTVVKNDSIRERMSRMNFSASALESYIRCPLRFYYAYIAGLEERSEISLDPDTGELGSLVHRVLERFYRNAPIRENSSRLEGNLRDLITDEFEKKGFNIASGIGKIRHWVLHEKLKDFLTADSRRLLLNGIEIASLEKKVETEIDLPFSDSPVRFRGRIDRIEREGNLMRLIDYKTGAPFNPKIIEKGIKFRLERLKDLKKPEWLSALRELQVCYESFQLLLYALMVTSPSGDYSGIDAAYMFLKQADDFFKPVFIRGTGSGMISIEEKDTLMKNFKHNLHEIMADIYLRDTFSPNNRNIQYCSTCPFRIPCGNM
jgi:ATP-dependent helicase/nuclease subunit B